MTHRLSMASISSKLLTPSALIAVCLSSPAEAQQGTAAPQTEAPNAGTIVREPSAPPSPPGSNVSVSIPVPSRAVLAAGGPKVGLSEIRFDGNVVISSEQLAALVKQAVGKDHDLAGLHALADLVSAHYHQRGYGFAKAFVPKNGLNQGVLTIYIVEGRLGALTVHAANPQHATQAEAVLAPLKAKRSDAIYVPDLERQVLLLSDRPGYSMLPTLKPGTELGTGDLDVQLTRNTPVRGNAALSNHGNRYTGYSLARLAIQWDSPLMFGDQLSLSAAVSDGRLATGSLTYGVPLDISGLRGTLGYSRTDYRLGKEFAKLQATGQAEIATFGLSYPLLRQSTSNLTLAAQGQHKWLQDQQQSVALREVRRTDLAMAQLSFDRTDATGVSYGQLEFTVGRLQKSSTDPGQEAGRFSRITWDMTRLQALAERVSLMARYGGQRASRNLDSSEGYSLGGPYAIRAYPVGEGGGDEGDLIQMELRFSPDSAWSPFLFHDVGRVKPEKHPVTAHSQTRVLSGAGLGLRYQHRPIDVELVLARPLVGGTAQSDPSRHDARVWLKLSYRF